MSTSKQLKQVFNDNFVAYFRSHVAHVNITGRTFKSDHELLGEVYEDLQGQIDVIGELLRTLEEFMPSALIDVMEDSHVPVDSIEGSSDRLISEVYDDIEHLKGCYEDLIKIASEEGHDEISNYAQDRVLKLSKFCWMLRSTLE
jgi:DNA-binding ferritin-like protein